MKSETNNLWGGRFNEATDAFVKIFCASVSFDKILAFYDIEGSLAHATMLSEIGVLTSNELKQMDLVVGMTGDGVNDAPAVKNADVGFAMGDRKSVV